MRSKYDGGKVINRSQSGSWQHRCMGAGLQQNLGKEWVPTTWSKMTNSPPNNIFTTTAKCSAQKKEKDNMRKARDDVKARRRKNKYSRKYNSVAARKAYSRHDDDISPDDVTDDISDILSEMKKIYVTVHAKMCHKSAKCFPRFPRISHYYSRLYLHTKFDRHSPFTFRDIATFIR